MFLSLGVEVNGVFERGRGGSRSDARSCERSTPAGSLASLSGACDVIMLSLPDSTVIESVIRGPIIKGDYLEGGLTGRLMAKDVRLYLSLMEDLGDATLVGPGTLTAFQVSNALGYGDKISNRVVDALGDLAGGIRVAEQEG